MEVRRIMNFNLLKTVQTRIEHLSLRGKTLLITIAVMCTLVLTGGIGIDILIRSNFSRLETTWISDNARRMQRLILLEQEAMLRTTYDYAVWTETYNYIAGYDGGYLKANFSFDIFKNLQMYGAFLYYPDGTRKIGFTLSDDGESLSPAAREWDTQLSGIARKIFRDNADSLNGIIRSGNDLFLLSTHKVLHDAGVGPANGSLIYLRKINNTFLKRLSGIAGVYITLRDIPIHDAIVWEGETSKPNFFFTDLHGDTLDLNVITKDINDKPTVIFQMQFDRDIYNQGEKARYLFYLLLILMIIAIGILNYHLIWHLSISRVVRMIDEVKNVSETLDLSKRLNVREWDEIDNLAISINSMIDAFQKQREYCDVAEKEKESLQEYLLQAKKMEAVGTMAGGIAHDFNNMLGSMLGSAELLRLDIPEGDPRLEHVRRIEKAGQNASALVRQMLSLSKGYVATKTYFSTGQIVKDMLHLVKAGFPENIEINIQTDLTDDLIYADINQFQQIVINLATNASHAMAGKKNGVLTISISEIVLPSRDTHAETHTLPAGRYIKIEFRDTGTGISEDIKDKIFEPFFSTKPVGSGTGLGLSVVHNFVSTNGGRIIVESSLGNGTSFIMYLPAVKEKRIPAHSVHGTREEILLVDDDSLVRKTLIAGLTRLGYAVIEAASGYSALKVLEEKAGKTTLVITDQMMPGMSGYDLCKKIRAHHPDLPVILLSGYTSGLETDDAEQCFTRVLMKPVGIETLGKVIKEIINSGSTKDITHWKMDTPLH